MLSFEGRRILSQVPPFAVIDRLGDPKEKEKGEPALH
jgi:hypothetical protein